MGKKRLIYDERPKVEDKDEEREGVWKRMMGVLSWGIPDLLYITKIPFVTHHLLQYIVIYNVFSEFQQLRRLHSSDLEGQRKSNPKGV
jgi:hypothetical protein